MINKINNTPCSFQGGVHIKPKNYAKLISESCPEVMETLDDISRFAKEKLPKNKFLNITLHSPKSGKLAQNMQLEDIALKISVRKGFSKKTADVTANVFADKSKPKTPQAILNLFASLFSGK